MRGTFTFKYGAVLISLFRQDVRFLTYLGWRTVRIHLIYGEYDVCEKFDRCRQIPFHRSYRTNRGVHNIIVTHRLTGKSSERRRVFPERADHRVDLPGSVRMERYRLTGHDRQLNRPARFAHRNVGDIFEPVDVRAFMYRLREMN